MIDPKELRIGNLVLIDGDVLELTRENWENLIVFNTFNRIDPIPLTPVILEASGFVKRIYKDDEERRLYGNIEMWEREDGFILTPKDGGYFLNDHSITGVQIFRFLHQIQNLYYALKLEELEVKLP